MSISENEFSQMISGFGIEYSYPATFQPEGTPKDVMLEHLCNLVAPDGAEGQIVREKLTATYVFAEQAFQKANLRKRKSEDDIITHPLAVATILAEAGIVDLDIIQAAILHDTTEDTNITRPEIIVFINSLELDEHSDRGQKIDTLVDAVSKVKTLEKHHGIRAGEPVAADEEQLTMQKIFDSLNTDYRALFIKLADVAHNDLTLKHLRPEKQKVKARLAFEYFIPLAQSLGAYGFARLIGDAAYDIVQGGISTELAERTGGPAKIIRETREAIVTDELLKQISSNIDTWVKQIADYDCDDTIAERYVFNHPPSTLYHSANIDTPGIYEISQKMTKAKALTPEDYLPTVKIVVHNIDQMHQWFDMLTAKYGLTNGEETNSPWNAYYKKNEPVVKLVPIQAGNIQQMMKVELSNKEMNIMPIHLLKHSSGLTDRERTIALNKLELLRLAYEQAVISKEEPANTLAYFSQGLAEGKVGIFAPDRKLYSVPKGATYLDVAYTIGTNLGNTATGVIVTNGTGEPIPKELTDPAQPGDVCEFFAPKLADSREAVLPSRFDMVITPKAIKDIDISLKTRKNEKAVQADARRRGSRILKWIYEKRRGKRPDILFSHVFYDDQSLVDKYKSIRGLKRAIGYTAIPSQKDDFYDEWENQSKSSLVTSDAFALVDKLIELRKSLWGIKINIKDRAQILEAITGFVGEKGSMFPLRVSANEEEDLGEIEIFFIKGDEKLVDSLKEFLKRKYSKIHPLITKLFPENHPVRTRKS